MLTKNRAIVPFILLAGMSLFLAGCAGPNLIDYVFNFSRNGICLAIVVILDVIALVEVYGSSRSTGDKVVWSLIIIFFPILGCILYYMFARKK